MAFPATYNFSYYLGDRFDFIINPKNPNGTPFDLSSFDTALFEISTERGNPLASVGIGTAEIDAPNSRIVCAILPELGVQLSGTSYVYDVEIQDTSSSTVFTLLTGGITVTKDVARTGQA
jgi:hypothetical protein